MDDIWMIRGGLGLDTRNLDTGHQRSGLQLVLKGQRPTLVSVPRPPPPLPQSRSSPLSQTDHPPSPQLTSENHSKYHRPRSPNHGGLQTDSLVGTVVLAAFHHGAIRVGVGGVRGGEGIVKILGLLAKAERSRVYS